MKVALVLDPRSTSVVGGHQTQQHATMEALQAAAVDARIRTVYETATWDFDVLHYFGDPDPLFSLGPPRRPIVVSPIYFPRRVMTGPRYWEGGLLPMARERARHTLRRLIRRKGFRQGRQNHFRYVSSVRRADLIVVNSAAEGRLLAKDCPGALPPVRVAMSGVDGAFFGGDAQIGRRMLGMNGEEDFVLCVGRIEPRKNQAMLARAMAQVSAPLVLVGDVLPGNWTYFRRCASALPGMTHIPHIDHHLMPHIYAAAAVHILPSWYETTGLSTLEALAAGTPVVVGKSPCVEEYFGSCAEIADPGSVRSLVSAIQAALRGAKGCEIDLARSYSWAATASQLIEAYQAVLS